MSHLGSLITCTYVLYLSHSVVLPLFLCLEDCSQKAKSTLVEFFEVTFLPPSKEWFSGIISYPILLVFQIVIILVMAQVATDITKGTGRFSHSTPLTAKSLRIFGSIYLLSMILRYIIRMYIYPEERWTGGCIPIFFHWVLATFVLAWGNLCHK